MESIDHNLYAIGDKLYQSNYLSGLRVLDVSDAANGNLELVGYFDTNPESDAPSFNGTWSNYPYFPSGNIAVSTFTHFFVVRPSDAISPNPVTVDESGNAWATAVYPNPAQSTIQLEGFDGEANLVLYGMNGQLVKTWEGLPVINGDADDLRILDPKGGHIVALYAKGKAKRDVSGFVVDTPLEPMPLY